MYLPILEPNLWIYKKKKQLKFTFILHTNLTRNHYSGQKRETIQDGYYCSCAIQCCLHK